MENRKEAIEKIREFNRFYTVLIGTLNRNFLDTEYSVTETRILFELISNNGCSAKSLSETLHIDKSYMSRIIKLFEKKGLIVKEAYGKDHRLYIITLTDKGIKEAADLIGRANYQIGELISGLSMEECSEICMAMSLITDYFSKNDKERKQ